MREEIIYITSGGITYTPISSVGINDEIIQVAYPTLVSLRPADEVLAIISILLEATAVRPTGTFVDIWYFIMCVVKKSRWLLDTLMANAWRNSLWCVVLLFSHSENSG